MKKVKSILLILFSITGATSAAKPISNGVKIIVCKAIYEYYNVKPSDEELVNCLKTGDIRELKTLSLDKQILYSGGILADGGICNVIFDGDSEKVQSTHCGS